MFISLSEHRWNLRTRRRERIKNEYNFVVSTENWFQKCGMREHLKMVQMTISFLNYYYLIALLAFVLETNAMSLFAWIHIFLHFVFVYDCCELWVQMRYRVQREMKIKMNEPYILLYWKIRWQSRSIDCIYVSRNCVNNNNGVVWLRMACVLVDLYCKLRNIPLFWYTENPFEKWIWAHLLITM